MMVYKIGRQVGTQVWYLLNWRESTVQYTLTYLGKCLFTGRGQYMYVTLHVQQDTIPYTHTFLICPLCIASAKGSLAWSMTREKREKELVGKNKNANNITYIKKIDERIDTLPYHNVSVNESILYLFCFHKHQYHSCASIYIYMSSQISQICNKSGYSSPTRFSS